MDCSESTGALLSFGPLNWTGSLYIMSLIGYFLSSGILKILCAYIFFWCDKWVVNSYAWSKQVHKAISICRKLSKHWQPLKLWNKQIFVREMQNLCEHFEMFFVFRSFTMFLIILYFLFLHFFRFLELWLPHSLRRKMILLQTMLSERPWNNHFDSQGLNLIHIPIVYMKLACTKLVEVPKAYWLRGTPLSLNLALCWMQYIL